MILKGLLGVLEKIRLAGNVESTYSGSVPKRTVGISPSLTATKENSQMSIKGGLNPATRNFLRQEHKVKACDECGRVVLVAALDREEEAFVCPICDNGKDEDETCMGY